MQFDANLALDGLGQAGAVARAAEEIGFSVLWTSETAHDPFLPLALAATNTARLGLGTSIAVAFPRSPTIMAHTAWDLARASNGRFILGLGTQVKGHIERRFGMEWSEPAERLRDYIGAVRAVWASWQTGERLRYEGRFYRLSLMTPFFNPGPNAQPDLPIYIAGVNRHLCRLAGELCQGFHAHPFHTARYLREAVLPWIEEGLTAAGRSRDQIALASSVFVITGATDEARAKNRAAVRRQIAFYASTPSYRPVLEAHGWAERGEELGRLAARGRWDEMDALVDDALVDEIAVEGATLAEAAVALRARYDGLLDRAAFYLPFVPGERDEEWRAAVG